MKRYLVVAALFLLSMITYIDRACISTAKDAIASDLALSDNAMGMVFGAFSLGYAIAQIPSGMFIGRFGARAGLAIIVTAWSGLTMLTGAAWSLVSLVVIRFLFGIGEAGAFPGSNRALYSWLPVGERGLATGILFSGSRIGAAFAFPLLVWMLATWDWRLSFVILGAGGVLWAVLWFVWFRNEPPVPVAHAPATAGVGAAPALLLREAFRSRGMILNMLQYFASNFTFYLCLSWMLPFLKDHYQLTPSEAAGYSMVPLLVGASSQWVTGFLVDRIYHSDLRPWSRRLPAMLGFLLAAVGIFVISFMDSAFGAMICFTAATFGADMTISPSWSYCSDIAGKNTASISGAMNMLGNFGSFVSALAFPFLYGMTGTAATYFTIAAVLNVIGMLCWYSMRSLENRQTAAR